MRFLVVFRGRNKKPLKSHPPNQPFGGVDACGLRRSTSWAKVIPSRVKVTCKRLAFNRQSAHCKLNTRRARSAVIASALLLRAAAHDSGPMWVASSHWYDFYIRYASPV